MNKPKGGRGNKAPYETKLMRVPEPLANQVESLCQRYQEFLAGGGNPIEPPCFLIDLPKIAEQLQSELSNLKIEHKASAKAETQPIVETVDTVTYYKDTITYYNNQDWVRVRQSDSLPQTQRTKRFVSKYEGKCGRICTWSRVKGQPQYSVSFPDISGLLSFFWNEIELVDSLGDSKVEGDLCTLNAENEVPPEEIQTIGALPAHCPIEELQLSVRAYNCLKHAQINSVADLLPYNPEKLLELNNLGQKSVEEIVEALKRWEARTKRDSSIDS
ncbi:hypothetical protein NDI43_27555 [Microcoleus vaginatus GB2-A3]|uniref:DNA-directed RNA polymerase subunit alpha C-terminal domain-containing protein n=1 Tax=Microcoleus vaginatus TaxID=119532 RepID=UPI0032A1D909